MQITLKRITKYMLKEKSANHEIDLMYVTFHEEWFEILPIPLSAVYRGNRLA